MVLKSGNLIIHNLTVKDEGTYRCSARISRFSKSFFNGVVYNLSLSANETSKLHTYIHTEHTCMLIQAAY